MHRPRPALLTNCLLYTQLLSVLMLAGLASNLLSVLYSYFGGPVGVFLLVYIYILALEVIQALLAG